jgi:hypothetical protein
MTFFFSHFTPISSFFGAIYTVKSACCTGLLKTPVGLHRIIHNAVFNKYFFGLQKLLFSG